MNTKKSIEAVIAGGVLVVSLNANATSACNDGTIATLTSGGYLNVSIVTRCSANVFIDASDQTSSFSTKGASKKGKTVFGSNSDAGNVSVCSTFTTWAAPTAGNSGCS